MPKCPDPHNEHGGPSLICLLTLLFNGFLNDYYVPDSLTEVCTVPIPKSNVGDMASFSNYRPIALAAAISKLFEKCLYSLISPQIDSSYYQFRFKEGSSTEFCVFILKSVVQYFWIFSSPVFACFVDAKAAFDRVNLEKLLAKIDIKRDDRRIIGTLQYCFEVQHFKIKWSGYFSECFPVLNGVRQGGVLSLLLYNLYVDDLNLHLAKTGVGCFIGGVCFNNLSYADDLVILAPTVAALNHLFSICDEFASANDIVFYTAKTQCMAFIHRGTPLKHIPMAWLSGVSLSFVGSFKYLGFTVVPTLSDELHVKALSRSLCGRANLLIQLTALRCTV
ncbi:hypothetical protein QYM36_003220 [Artemia franciscana]|uniref:Reverse transcriptase domain-containing protein n=1 Tax=Artemia franciscana TaxID=6661 RepID=A0AA88L924_ARTSF|nr:hypothetical protein QYM36_003220 [Artemia franciscana]